MTLAIFAVLWPWPSTTSATGCWPTALLSSVRTTAIAIGGITAARIAQGLRAQIRRSSQASAQTRLIETPPRAR